jgi:2-oxoglutarate ferredoxin oxidoreductase subunit alpha
MEAFDLADKYRNPVMILGDGLIGQMMEPVEFKRHVEPDELPEKPWATTGAVGRGPNIVNSLYLQAADLEQHNQALGRKYRAMEAEVRHETYRTEDDPDVLIVAYGTVARIARTSIDTLREKGLKVGLFRPVTLFPYPTAALAAAALRAKRVLVAELSMGQMLEDVRAAVAGRVPVDFFGRCGGMVMTAEELAEQAEKLAVVPV